MSSVHVRKQLSCLTNTDSALNHSSRVMKWCIPYYQVINPKLLKLQLQLCYPIICCNIFTSAQGLFFIFKYKNKIEGKEPIFKRRKTLLLLHNIVEYFSLNNSSLTKV